MATEKPKISAYVPQEVFDQFKKYQQERGLTMSQACTQVLSEYFNVYPEGNPSIRVEQFWELERRVSAVEKQLKPHPPSFKEFFSQERVDKYYKGKK